ncbi:uncharacterized protein B0H18DRAFT_1123284 [Fomitopsis serialis]|uniref:uncharacterized protein n=1 Tax=Fomitopsis serialis TaxID=139415 RepID=UPI0020073ACD|nr:uncharacterized protein B0H18DRAFT_1123284 [Neoantrodia serialis]KAH9918012.1 hypothetical protein B0H18DRAFT_1123284 [Neoantrodia serialis]
MRSLDTSIVEFPKSTRQRVPEDHALDAQMGTSLHLIFLLSQQRNVPQKYHLSDVSIDKAWQSLELCKSHATACIGILSQSMRIGANGVHASADTGDAPSSASGKRRPEPRKSCSCSSPSLLAAGGEDHIITVWDMATKKEVARFLGHTDNVKYLSFSHDNRHIVSASADGSVCKWELPALATTTA